MQAIVKTGAGAVQGRAANHGFAFLGIPYAEPPFGENRFKAPVPVAPWDGVRDARESAPTAPQPAVGFTMIPEPTKDGGDSPSCLSLNVFTPDLGAAGLPVLVWIHGGGFVNGTPSSPWYDGRSFNRDGVVVVSVGYRLGAEGFLHIEGAPNNRGVLDWIAALEWVQDNIAVFGGDPAKVTIGGQSAGGGAVTTLSTLPAARGLFRRVIPMSGSAFRHATIDLAANIAKKAADALGTTPTLEGLAGVHHADLVAAQSAASADPDRPVDESMVLAPYVDGDLIPMRISEAIRAGASDEFPFLIGATAEEFNMGMAGVELEDDSVVRKFGRMGLDDAAVAAYRGAHPTFSNGALVGQAITDRMFRLPGVRVAEARAGASFHYDFRWRTPSLGGAGACHCIDLPFAWDILDAEHVSVVAGDEPPQALADAMHSSWVRFIVDGDPGWPAYNSGSRATMVFDETSKVVDDALAFERTVWP